MPQFIPKVNVTNGSPTVVILGQDATARTKAGVVFMRKDTNAPYFLAGVGTYTGGNTEVTLTGNYAGATESNVDGVFTTDLTYPDNIPTLSQGDVGTAAVYTAAMYRIQQLLAVAAGTNVPANIIRGNNTGGVGPQLNLTPAEVATMLGLGSAAYVATSTFATAAQGATADTANTTANAALPKAGGTMTGAIAMGANAISGVKAITYSPYDGGNSGTAWTFDYNNGARQRLALTGNVTITLADGPAGVVLECELIVTQDATGSRTITWAGGNYSASRWLGSAAAIAIVTAANGETLFRPRWDGSKWYMQGWKVGAA